MARTMRAPKLEPRSARLKLAIAKRPHWTQIGKGVSLGYRRNQGPGTWNVRVAHRTGHWSKTIGTADDYAESNTSDVLTYWEAAEKARTIGNTARYGGGGKLGTVLDALDAYEASLKQRGADAGNASRVRMYLPAALAASAVGMFRVRDFVAWRQALTDAGLSPAAFNRSNVGLRAALNLAASQDEGITNSRAWQTGLVNIPNAGRARNVVLSEQDVRGIVAAAYEQGSAFGLLVETLAVTGARVSQAARIEVGDLQADRGDPRVLMPSSHKGGGGKQIEHRPVPITSSLAAKLKAQAAGRSAEAPLLVKGDGTAWRKSNHAESFAAAAKTAGLDPRVTTVYSLRHTSITRQLLAGTPIRLVATLHDTSTRMIEQNYSRHISDHSDTIARRALLDLDAPAAANVIPLSVRS
jgi:integrase